MTRENPENKENKEPQETAPKEPGEHDGTLQIDVRVEDGVHEDDLPPTGTENVTPLVPPLPAPGASGVIPKKNNTGHKRSNTNDASARDTADEYTDVDEKGKKGKRKSQAPRNPTLQAQMTALMERMDRQAQRTDQIYSMIRPNTPERQRPPSRSTENSPSHRDIYHKRPVYGSHYKKTSPKNGHSRFHTSRHNSRRRHYSSRSSESSPSDSDTQVRRALEMLEPRFHRHKGKHDSRDDKIARYRPFAFLDREQQRLILKSGHPEELNLTQHLSGLCAMAQDQCDKRGNVHAILSHITQLLDDQSYMQWHKVRAFSNTVVSNIARGNWMWLDDKMIERCRNNIYMRSRSVEEPAWSAPCPRYNRGRCEHQETHSVGEVEMRHVCMYCAASGFENTHTLRACNWKRGKSGGNQYNKPNQDERRDNRPQRHQHVPRSDNVTDSSKN